MYAATGFNCVNGAESSQRFHARFPKRDRVFLPVIYVADEEQALSNAVIARDADADGVFLINHGVGYQRLLRIAHRIIERHPGLFVGINCLDLRPQDVICRLPVGVNAVWTSDPPTGDTLTDTAIDVRQARQAMGWDGLFFGAPFSESEQEKAGGAAMCTTVPGYIDVPTIVVHELAQQGIQVVQTLRRTFSRWPLAVAADIGTDTIDALLPYANCVMTTARTGDALEHMDPDESRRLATKTHEYRPAVEEG